MPPSDLCDMHGAMQEKHSDIENKQILPRMRKQASLRELGNQIQFEKKEDGGGALL